MGIYYDRGVHYVVILKDGSRVTVLGSRHTDARLERSPYYLDRRSTWFADSRVGLPAYVKLNSEPISTTAEEEAAIEKALKDHCAVLEDHGWYDVLSTSSTLT